MRISTKELSVYVTWYDFKVELQRRSGLVVLNRLWRQVKPRAPLPWHEAEMKESLVNLSGQIQRMTTCPRCRGNLVLDRDMDGYYKRCIQCSFNVAFEPRGLLSLRQPERKAPALKFKLNPVPSRN